MKTITTQDLKVRIGQDIGLHVWNVTGEQYFKGEMIPGSKYIPAEKLASAIKNASLPKDAQIVVYCAGPKCPASKNAAEQLESLGFTNVSKYAGGIEEWKGAGNTIDETCTSGACATTSCDTMTEKKHACGSC
jgi:rhodanese-related sulfurtransferase